MNIKKAKEEIKYAIQAYLAKDEFGEYRIPAVRQRPVLLMGAPGIGKTAVMEQVARECGVALVSYYAPYASVCHRAALYQQEGIRRKGIYRNGIHHERNYRIGL